MTAREIDAALGADPDFLAVCALRAAGYRAHLDAVLSAADDLVECTCCHRWVPWYAVDTDGRCDTCPAAARRAA